MVLILGALGAGKRAYAKTLGFGDADLSADPYADAPVLTDLEACLRSDPASGERLFPVLLTKRLVLCREVGSGVIPLDPNERAWREAVGRLCCALAKEATAVVRVTAGIPIAIKGVLPCIFD